MLRFQTGRQGPLVLRETQEVEETTLGRCISARSSGELRPGRGSLCTFGVRKVMELYGTSLGKRRSPWNIVEGESVSMGYVRGSFQKWYKAWGRAEKGLGLWWVLAASTVFQLPSRNHSPTHPQNPVSLPNLHHLQPPTRWHRPPCPRRELRQRPQTPIKICPQFSDQMANSFLKRRNEERS